MRKINAVLAAIVLSLGSALLVSCIGPAPDDGMTTPKEEIGEILGE